MRTLKALSSTMLVSAMLLAGCGTMGLGPDPKANVAEDKVVYHVNDTKGQAVGALRNKTYVAIRKLDEPTTFSLGLVVNELNPEIAKTLGLEGEHGVLVVDVETNSPSERAGIQPGDVITKVGTKEVRSVLDCMTLMEEFLESNTPVSIFVKNKGFITLK